MSINKADLWKQYVSKNPHWETDNVTLTPNGLKKLFDQTYDYGMKHGKNIQKGIDSLNDMHDSNDSNDMNDMNDSRSGKHKPEWGDKKNGVSDMFGGVFGDIFK